MRSKRIKNGVSSLCVAALLAACSSGSTSSSGDNVGGQDTPVSTSSVTRAYPAGLAVSQPFKASATSASIAKSPLINAAVSSAPQSFADKQAELDAIVNATTLSGCFNFTPPNLGQGATNVDCYGPNVDYSNHPEGIGGSGQLPSGDLGIWNSSNGSSNEACLASKINSLVAAYEARLDIAMLMMASATCVAKVNSLTLPTNVGDSTDLTAGFLEATASASETVRNFLPTFTAVSLSRLSNTSSDKPRYKLSLTGTTTVSGGGGNSSMTITMNLIHSPQDDTNSTYRGIIQMKSTGTVFNSCGPSGGGEGISILYDKSSSTDLKYRLRQGTYCDTTSELFTTDTGELDPSINHNVSSSGWNDNFNIALFNLNPSDGTGTFAYSWQAGAGDSNTRVFNATLSSTGGTDGAKGGCGYFGYGPASGEAGVTSIDRMICNWAGPGGNHTGVSKVQRQCVSLNSSSGVYESVSAQEAIHYAPVTDCDASSDASFTYNSTSGTNTNDSNINTGKTSDLINLSDMVFTAPTAPSAP